MRVTVTPAAGQVPSKLGSFLLDLTRRSPGCFRTDQLAHPYPHPVSRNSGYANWNRLSPVFYFYICQNIKKRIGLAKYAHK